MPYTSLCLCSLDFDKSPPPPGARLPWAMTPCINKVIAACSYVLVVSLSPIFRPSSFVTSLAAYKALSR
jgi:hypothetical protein